MTIHIGDLLKQSKPEAHLAPLMLPVFQLDPSLCVVYMMEDYLFRTKPLLKNETQLFINTVASYQSLDLHCT